MSNSKAQPHTAGFAALAGVAATATFLWALARGRVLLYGDATAHLAIARRMVDSATPGWSQWGTVWLPLPHLLMAALVRLPGWWRTGTAGAVVSIAGLVAGTAFLHRLVDRHWGRMAAAWAALFFSLNPSLLYLSAVPMTESLYLAVFLGLVDACDRGAVWEAGGWGLAATLCRYDGWFALPFALALLLARRLGWRSRAAAAWRFCLLAGTGPLLWLAYNAWYFDDPLAFARGPYSARQIYGAALRAGGARYPGDHALATAALYFSKTVALTCGVPLLELAAVGAALLWMRRRNLGTAAAALLLLPWAWYLWAMWSGNVPIFVPQYWPHGYYNLRYGVQALPSVAVFSGIAVAALTRAAGRLELKRAAPSVALGLGILCGAGYILMLRAPGPVAYAEAAHNAPDRLAAERGLAVALAPRRPGERVLMYFASFPGALADDGIPVREVIQESNFMLWQNALLAPQRYAAWVVIEAHGPVDKLVDRRALGRYFHPVATIHAGSEPPIEVYQRNGANSQP